MYSSYVAVIESVCTSSLDFGLDVGTELLKFEQVLENLQKIKTSKQNKEMYGRGAAAYKQLLRFCGVDPDMLKAPRRSKKPIQSAAEECKEQSAALLEQCLYELHDCQFPSPNITWRDLKRNRDVNKQPARVCETVQPMQPREAYSWYNFAMQRQQLVDEYGRLVDWKKLDRFLSLIHNNFKHPHHVCDRRYFVMNVVNGDVKEPAPATVALTGTDTIHRNIHHLLADCQHRKLDNYILKSDAKRRREQDWTNGFEAELQTLAWHYLIDLSVNCDRYASWLSLGQCFAWLAENKLDQRVLGLNQDIISASNTQQPDSADVLFVATNGEALQLEGDIMTHFARAKRCYLFASTLDNTRAEHWDQLGFLAFTRLRYGRRDSETISEAIECFTNAMARNQDEWMYPFMLGKLEEMRQSPQPLVYLAYYGKAIQLHRRIEQDRDVLDNAELFHRLHSSRLKCALTESIADDETWQLLLQLSYELPSEKTEVLSAALADSKLISDRRAIIAADVGKALRDIRDPKLGPRKAAFARSRESDKVLKNLKWFFKGVHRLGSYMAYNEDYHSCAKEMSVLFQSKVTAQFFWQMHNFRHTDFGDTVFVTESKFDLWRIRCFYLYVYALMRSGDCDDELMILNECLRKGSDKRKLNRRWTQEARCVVLLARFHVLQQRCETTYNLGNLSAGAIVSTDRSGQNTTGSMSVIYNHATAEVPNSNTDHATTMNDGDNKTKAEVADTWDGHRVATLLRSSCALYGEIERFPEIHEFVVDVRGNPHDWTILGSNPVRLIR
eukprot:SAG31_NODE_1512_length_8055_cov_3.286199_9_plen_784_part_00